MKTKSNINRVGISFCTLLILFVATLSANAAVIAYDGFAAGVTADGRATNATAYTTVPFSSDGKTNDSLHTQSPVLTGFDDGDAWNADGGTVATHVYFQAQNGGLLYQNFKPNTPGQARFFRSSHESVDSKWAERTVTTTDISAVQWVALLVRFSSSPTNTWTRDFVVTLRCGESEDKTVPYEGGWTPAMFGVRQSDGKAFYRTATGVSKVDVVGAAALDPGTTHLFLLRFADRPGTSDDNRYDDVTLWVDPELTANPDDLTGGLAAVSLSRADIVGIMHPLDKITISAAVNSGSEIAFDEFIVTDDYQDIYNSATETSITNLSFDATYIRTGSPSYTTFSPDKNYNDIGQIIVGHTGDEVLRGLIEFDLGSIPTYCQITSISLDMTTDSSSAGINDVGAPGALTLFNIYEYGFDIDETTATWNEPDADASDMPGGTSGTLLSSTYFNVEIKGHEVVFEDSVAFRTAVSSALEGDKILRLILRIDDETLGAHDFARFSDDTVSSTSDHPQLQITYWPIPPKGTFILVY